MRRIRRAHLNRRHQAPRQLRHPPMEIADAAQTFANDGEEFVMTVGEDVFSAKDAREGGVMGH